MSIGFNLLPLPYKNIVGQGLAGSRMYGLESAGSDLDTLIITSGLPTPPVLSHIHGDEDLTLMDVEFLSNLISTKAPSNLVDVLRADTFTWNQNHPMHPYLMSTQYSQHTYQYRLMKWSVASCDRSARVGTLAGRLKALRHALRCCVKLVKAQRSIASEVRFTPSERAFVFESSEELLEYPVDILHEACYTLTTQFIIKEYTCK